MAKIFVICGHGAGDSGAVGNGFTEAERVRALGKRIKELGGENVELADTNRNYYADNGISKLNISKDYQICELHLDSAAPTAKGGHVIIKEGLNPDKYDTALVEFISTTFPGRSQNIVKRSDLANPKRAHNRGYSYRLIEVCFISNKDDIEKFNKNLDVIAEGILKAFDITPIKNNDFKIKIETTKAVKVKIRKDASMKSDFVGYLEKGTYTITETKKSDGLTWGKLKSGGWIATDYVKKI